MATIATLVAKLVGDIGPFVSSMKQAEGEAKNLGGRISGAMNGALGTIGDVAKVAGGLAVAGIGAATTAAIGWVAAFNSWAGELDSIGDVLGTTADESAGLAVAIKTVGGDVEGITGQMAKLTRGLEGTNGKLGPTGKLLTSMGVAFQNANGQMLPATEILTGVADKLAKMPDGLEKTRIMTELFGKSGKDLSDTMNALANGGLANAEEKARALGLAIGDEGVNKSIEFGKSFETLKMALEGVAVSIGSAIMPVLVPLIQRFSEWAVSVMPQVQTAIQAVFGWLQANVGPILQNVITLLQNIVAWVQANWPQIQTTIINAWNTINATIGPVINAIGSLIQSVFGTVATFIQQHGEDIKGFVSNTWNTIRSIVEPIVNWLLEFITTVFGGISTFINQNQSEIQRIIQGVWDGIKMFIGTVLEVIRGIVNVALALLRGDISGALNAIQTMFTNIWNGIKEYVGRAVETMRMLLEIAWLAIQRGVSDAWNGIRTAIENAWNGIVKFFEGLWDGLVQIGRNIIQGIIEGLRQAGDAIGQFLQGLIDQAIANIKASLGIQSPSTVMAGIGMNMMEGLAAGIGRGADLPHLALDRISAEMVMKADAASAGGGQAQGQGQQDQRQFVLNVYEAGRATDVAHDFALMQALMG